MNNGARDYRPPPTFLCPRRFLLAQKKKPPSTEILNRQKPVEPPRARPLNQRRRQRTRTRTRRRHERTARKQPRHDGTRKPTRHGRRQHDQTPTTRQPTQAETRDDRQRRRRDENLPTEPAATQPPTTRQPKTPQQARQISPRRAPRPHAADAATPTEEKRRAERRTLNTKRPQQHGKHPQTQKTQTRARNATHGQLVRVARTSGGA